MVSGACLGHIHATIYIKPLIDFLGQSNFTRVSILDKYIKDQ